MLPILHLRKVKVLFSPCFVKEGTKEIRGSIGIKEAENLSGHR